MSLKKLIVLGCLIFVSCSTSERFHYRGVASSDEGRDYMEEVLSIQGKPALIKAKKRFEKLLSLARQEPYGFFKQLREEEPVFFVPGGKGLLGKVTKKAIPEIVVATKFDDVTEILKENKVFQVRAYTGKMDKAVGRFMLGHDDNIDGLDFEKEKTVMRHMMYGSDHKTKKRNLEKVKAIVDRIVSQGIKNADLEDKKHGEIDVIKHFTRDIPIEVVRSYFGFEAPVTDMKRWSRATQQSFFHNPVQDKKIDKKAVEAGSEMRSFITGELRTMAEAKIASGKYKFYDVETDVVTKLYMAEKYHKKYRLDSDRLASNIMGMLVGAVETTNAAIIQSLEYMLDHPTVLKGALEAAENGDDKLLRRYAWEALRFNPVNPWVARVSVRDFTLASGVKIKKGSLVLASTESAMFDENVFKDPDMFKLNRPLENYFHLGFARHRCLGDDVAIEMIPQTIKALLLNFPYLRRAKAGEQVDFQEGPFPESYKLIFGDVPSKTGFFNEKKETLGLVSYILKKVKLAKEDDPEVQELWSDLKKGLKSKVLKSKNKKKKEKFKRALKKFPHAITDKKDEVATHGEFVEACMDVNPKSKEIFHNIEDRRNYCEVRIDFRTCYLIEIAAFEQTRKDAYVECVDRGFLTDKEQGSFKEQFSHHANFNYLNEM